MKPKKFLSFILISVSALHSYGQEIRGNIVDTLGNPIPLTNVILMSLPDSSYLNGTVTDNKGFFVMPKDSNHVEGKTILKITNIGFKNLYVRPAEDLEPIILHEEIFSINTSVVRAKRPAFKVEKGAIKADVEHTLLADLGNGVQVLGRLPFVTESGNQVSVFGRGTPLIYIDNQKVQDPEELLRLSSADIKNVEVILNPGVSYESAVKSVIKITTIRHKTGLSMNLISTEAIRHYFGTTQYIKLNYRYKNWDFFGGLGFSYNKSRSTNKNTIGFHDKADEILVEQSLTGRNKNRSYNGNAGINYSDSKKFDFGIKYNFNRLPSYKSRMEGDVNYFENEIPKTPTNIHMLTRFGQNSDRINSYYIMKLPGEGKVDLNLDYIQGNSHSFYRVLRMNEDDVLSSSWDKYRLYVGKLQITNSLFGGKINYGTEISYTDNKQRYEEENSDITPFNNEKSEQTLWSLFVSQSMDVKDFSFEAGCRFESADYKYFEKGELRKEQSKTYNRFFPFFQVNYGSGKKVSMSLSYVNSVTRPVYADLSSNVVYVDSYIYNSGNSKLKPEYENVLDYMLSWKDLVLDVSCTWYKDCISNITKKMDGYAAVLRTIENLPSFKELSADISYSPTFFGIWEPVFDVGVFKPWMTYNGKNYNKAYPNYSWKNMLRISKYINLSFNLFGTLGGNGYTAHFKSTFRSDVAVSAKLLKNRLLVKVEFADVFNTYKSRVSQEVNNTYFYQSNRPDWRGISIQLNYKFNPVGNKYKGGSMSSELKRL